MSNLDLAPPPPPSTCILFRMPRDILRHSLLFVEAGDVRAVSQCARHGRGQITTTGLHPNQRPTVTLHSFLDSLAHTLDDRDALLRESSLRRQRFQTMGYKHGLDITNDRVDTEGLMQQPFQKGFQIGVRKGWKDAMAQGMIAAMACFTHRHGKRFETTITHAAATINNAANSKVRRQHTHDEAQQKSPSIQHDVRTALLHS